MLKEDQAAELLRRCELITNQRLTQIRGNLKKAESRSAAILELLVIEEISKIAHRVDYEPDSGASPDILLTLDTGRKIWIEIAFVYPRFGKEKRKSDLVQDWIIEEAKRRNISPYKISFRFDGEKQEAGFKTTLPKLHEKKKFLQDSEIIGFFETIKQFPSQKYSFKHSYYSLKLIYDPKRDGPFISSGGLVQEAPKTVKENNVYRVLDNKRRQHNVPRLIFLGSDQSPIFSDSRMINSARDSIFSKTQSISGVILLSISNYFQQAKYQIFDNKRAKEPLTETDINRLYQMNFNRWKYSAPLEQYEPDNKNGFRRVSGKLGINKVENNTIQIEIPSKILLDALAGKTDLKQEYGPKENKAFNCINEGWIVTSCSWKEGNIEAGEDSKVILELEPPPEAVYWPNKN